jgi:hypothetical protein
MDSISWFRGRRLERIALQGFVLALESLGTGEMVLWFPPLFEARVTVWTHMKSIFLLCNKKTLPKEGLIFTIQSGNSDRNGRSSCSRESGRGRIQLSKEVSINSRSSSATLNEDVSVGRFHRRNQRFDLR